jgi:hypothetical protein
VQIQGAGTEGVGGVAVGATGVVEGCGVGTGPGGSWLLKGEVKSGWAKGAMGVMLVFQVGL